MNQTKEKDLYEILMCGPGSAPITWAITKDHGVVNDCTNATEEQIKELKKRGLVHHFKMYDDDGECYYSGYSNDDSSFDPLDHFGMPNAGCTELKYRNADGTYSTL